MKTKPSCALCNPIFNQRNRMILSMLKDFEQLGNDPMARIDARLFHNFYLGKCKQLGIVKGTTSSPTGLMARRQRKGNMETEKNDRAGDAHTGSRGASCSAATGHRWRNTSSDGNRKTCVHCGMVKHWGAMAQCWHYNNPPIGSARPSKCPQCGDEPR